jgi:phage gpG-like protein
MLKVEAENSAKLISRLQGIPKSVMDAVAEAVRLKGLEALRLAKEKVLVEALKNRRGTLRCKVSVRHTRNAGLAKTSVGMKLSYAAAHEFGLKATGDVKAHLRRIKAQKKTDIKKGLKRSGKAIQAGAYDRNFRMGLPKRSFLRAVLKRLRPGILAALNEAVRKGIR